MFSPDTLISELLARPPSVANLLIELRVDCVGCSMNNFCDLSELCLHYGLDLDKVLLDIEGTTQPT